MVNRVRFWGALQIAALLTVLAVSFSGRQLQIELTQSNGRDAADFPFAIEQGNEKLASVPRTMKLDGLTPIEEPKAADNPIGVAEAAKILKDSEIFEKSKQSGAMDSWKAAVKNSGPAIIQDVTDDATTYNPFPKSSLSDKMEIQDVWNKAQALAKPAGASDKLDGDAITAKKAIENAESQADASAYMAANEAAAVDAYDVSIPNVDMMARNKPKVLSGRALARTPSHVAAMRNQALKPLVQTRVQALAEIPREDDGRDALAAAQQAAVTDVQAQKQQLDAISAEMREVRGREEEAQRLSNVLNRAVMSAQDARDSRGFGQLLRARGAALDDLQAHQHRLQVLQDEAQEAQGKEDEAERVSTELGAPFSAFEHPAAAAAAVAAAAAAHQEQLQGGSAQAAESAAAADVAQAAADSRSSRVAKLRRQVQRIKTELAAAAASISAPSGPAGTAVAPPAVLAKPTASAARPAAAAVAAAVAPHAPAASVVAQTFNKALNTLPPLSAGAAARRPSLPLALMGRNPKFDRPTRTFESVFGFHDKQAAMPVQKLARAAA